MNRQFILLTVLCHILIVVKAWTFGHWYWTEHGLPAYEYIGLIITK